jgi:hypothetical protein
LVPEILAQVQVLALADYLLLQQVLVLVLLAAEVELEHPVLQAVLAEF